jgi:type II secretory pathway pseudopilin PulG
MGKEEDPIMNCSNCGNTLAPGSAYCTICGTLTDNSPAPAERANGSQRGPGDLSQTESVSFDAHPRRAQTAFYGRYGARGNMTLPSPSSLGAPSTLTATETRQEAMTPTLAPNAPTAPKATTASPAPTALMPISKPETIITETAAPRARRPLVGRLIVLVGIIIVIALLVSLSTFGYRAYTKVQTEARATATVNARSQATAVAGAQATATASTPLFTDTLTSNTNDWPTDGTTTFFEDGQYHLHNPDPTLTLNSYYQHQVFDNFKVQITVTSYSDGNPNADVPYAYGLILRADPTTPANKYVFFVSPLGTYNFARHDADGFYNNGWSDLTTTPWASSSAIHTGKGATNTLTVIAEDAMFSLFINGQLVETVTDTFVAFTSGWIGVMDEGADMEAGFSNLQVTHPGA